MEIIDFKLRRRSKSPGAPWGRLMVLASTARATIRTVGEGTTDSLIDTFSFKLWVPLSYLPRGVFSLLSNPETGLRWVQDTGAGISEDLSDYKQEDNIESAVPSVIPEKSGKCVHLFVLLLMMIEILLEYSIYFHQPLHGQGYH